ncbi:MAG: hypothetical protein JXQ90_18405 [Cyclobacteriaceae bacterium]
MNTTGQKNTQIAWWVGGTFLTLATGATIYFLVIKKNEKKYRYRSTPGKQDYTDSNSRSSGKGTVITEPAWNRPFDMNYAADVRNWLKKEIKTLPLTDAKRMANTLFKAKGNGWLSDDDEGAVKKIFMKQLQDKVQVSNLSAAFWNNHNQRDMWEHLRSFLSDWELENYVSKPVAKLDNYRLA